MSKRCKVKLITGNLEKCKQVEQVLTGKQLVALAGSRTCFMKHLETNFH